MSNGRAINGCRWKGKRRVKRIVETGHVSRAEPYVKPSLISLLVLHAWFLFGVFRACGPGPCLAWSGPRTCLTASLNNPSNLIYLLGSHARMPAPAITIYLIVFLYPLRVTLVTNPSRYRDLFKGLISLNRWFFIHSRYIKLSILYLSGLSIYHLCRTVLVLFIY